ncbi:MAG: archaeosortase/exosortase family protein [Bacteroidales bacterium]
MGWIKKLQYIYNQYIPLSHYVLLLLLLLPVYPFLRQSLTTGNSAIVDGYAHGIKQGSVLLAQWLGMQHHSLLKIFLSPISLDTRYMAFWQTLLFVIGTIFLNTSVGRRIVIGAAGLLAMYVFNVVRWLILTHVGSYYGGEAIILWNATLIVLLNLLLLGYGYWWWKRNFPLKRLIIAKLQIAPVSIRKVIRNLLIVASLLIITQWITNTQTLPLISWLSKAVLYSSQFLLNLLDYTTYVSGRYIYTREAAIFFSDTCAGIELMIIYASFIAILNGKYKAPFIAGGIFVIFLMNVVRISMIMIYLIHNKGHYNLPIDIHDLYTYPVYAVTFLLWAIWIHFFNKVRT